MSEAGTQHKKSYNLQTLTFRENGEKEYGALMDISWVGFRILEETKMYEFSWTAENGVFTVTFSKKPETPAGGE